MRSLYFTVVKEKKMNCFGHSIKAKENYCAMNKKKMKIRHLCTKKKKELAKEGLYVYLKSQHYHFDRQWKELERPNASFEGRTTHPIIIQLHSNFSFFFLVWKKISIIAKERHTRN